jgi:nicotinamidase/pyrazinamidase
MNALLVVDMLTGFCRPGFPLSFPESTESLEERIADRVRRSLAAGDQVLFACDAHHPSDPELKQYPPHCLAGSPEAQIVPTLASLASHSTVVTKRSFSPFFETTMAAALSRHSTECVEVVGICTDICVLFAVAELRYRGYRVTIDPESVKASRPDRQRPALLYLSRVLGAELTSSAPKPR